MTTMRSRLALVLLCGLACDAKSETKREDKSGEKAATVAKQGGAPPETKPETKPEAKPEVLPAAKPVTKPEAKSDAEASDAPAPAAGPAGLVAPAERPAGVPADWQRVSGDVWSFWVPADWKVLDYQPGDGGTGDKGDKIAEAQRSEGGMPIASLGCVMRSDLGMPTAMAELEPKALARAKGDAKKHAATSSTVEVEHPEGPQKALQIEYQSSGDGTLVLERWAVSQRALGLSCSDQSGSTKAQDRKILETVLGSLRWIVGD